MDQAIDMVQRAEVLMVVGTSLQVYPAAGLVDLASYATLVLLVDPNPALASSSRITVIAEPASTGVNKAIDLINSL
jgi:NAD-dependent deacetylase